MQKRRRGYIPSRTNGGGDDSNAALVAQAAASFVPHVCAEAKPPSYFFEPRSDQVSDTCTIDFDGAVFAVKNKRELIGFCVSGCELQAGSKLDACTDDSVERLRSEKMLPELFELDSSGIQEHKLCTSAAIL